MKCVRVWLCVRRQRQQQLQYEAGVIQSRGELCYSPATTNDITGKLFDDRCQDAMPGNKHSSVDYVVNTSTTARLHPSHQHQLSSSDSVCLGQTLRRYVDHMDESSHFPTTWYKRWKIPDLQQLHLNVNLFLLAEAHQNVLYSIFRQMSMYCARWAQVSVYTC